MTVFKVYANKAGTSDFGGVGLRVDELDEVGVAKRSVSFGHREFLNTADGAVREACVAAEAHRAGNPNTVEWTVRVSGAVQ